MKSRMEIGWDSQYYRTWETLSLDVVEDGYEVNSVIETESGKATFHIAISEQWEVLRFDVVSTLTGTVFEVHGIRDKWKGWIVNGKPMPEFDGCIDIDILPTPFTNTLPIRRLDFGAYNSHEILVLYIDLIEKTVSRKKQVYTKLSDSLYRFETVPKDFETNIEVDADGFVLDYPDLFARRHC
ncbi:putative glycolipid-binding domain-containing protein [Flavobacterium sp. MAH-1]|uniref:Putative glycolipid-binding domain-containing protein n=1 Tax=Flavobacterium agri TaxID=2743471 RepID=A0A7Y9C6H4_9FLAO|nr:putative glycolipid-binding domain-containing protein [Flavobacterium agri]NUY82382.1 putative glycolipid-binding domain-containing protein [Flavobacterium agri]NYA72406.1 putative glycolipid-binding domain-containing protein [Flavobacterium agri]